MRTQLQALLRAPGVLALLLAAACGDAAGDPAQRSLAEAADTARSIGVRALLALLVLAVAGLGIRVIDILARGNAARRPVLERYAPVARAIVWTLAVTLVARVLFDVGGAGLLAAAIIFAFAGRDVLRDVFGGITLAFDRPFDVGDQVAVGDVRGEVASIGLRSTRIITPDDIVVSVPNARIVTTPVSSAGGGSNPCPVVTDLYLPGGVDEALAKRVVRQVAVSSRYVHLGEPIDVHVRDVLRDTVATHLRVKAHVIDARHAAAFMSDVTERSRAELRRLGMLPIVDVHEEPARSP